MIQSGEKLEEYREIKDYWIKRLAACKGNNSYEKTGFYCKKALCISCIKRGNGFHEKQFDAIRFTNGYGKSRPSFLIECKEIVIGPGKTPWGAEEGEIYIILKLGKII